MSLDKKKTSSCCWCLASVLGDKHKGHWAETTETFLLDQIDNFFVKVELKDRGDATQFILIWYGDSK